MGKTNIEWTDYTLNPWIGCTKVSPGCLNCYAETRDQRFSKGIHWGKGAPRQRTSTANWKQPLKWDHEANVELNDFNAHSSLHGGVPRYEKPRRPRVFCASLADWLDDEVPIEWLCNLLELIHACQNLDWQLLTKRPQNWQWRLEAVLKFAVENEDQTSRDADRHDAFFHWLNLWVNAHQPPANVWIGTTVEDQKRADERIPALLKIPAKVRFLSCEPLLGEVRIARHFYGEDDLEATGEFRIHNGRTQVKVKIKQGALPRIGWVICGGESGPGARPMHPDWARSLRDQCAAASVPFFFKQWGEWSPAGGRAHFREAITYQTTHVDSAIKGERPSFMVKDGKKAAGRYLDGIEHNDFPATEVAS